MLEPQQKDLQDVLAGRLVEYIDDDLATTDVGVYEDRIEDEGKGTAQELLENESLSTDETSNDIYLSTRQANELQAPAFAKVEKSLISLGFFTPSSRRIKNQKIKTISFTRTIDGKKVIATAEFHPSATLGLPITADQDKFLALHHIITNLLKDTGTISNPIKFTSAEMLRLLNKERDSGKNYKDISEWLDVMMSTTIMSTPWSIFSEQNCVFLVSFQRAATALQFRCRTSKSDRSIAYMVANPWDSANSACSAYGGICREWNKGPFSWSTNQRRSRLHTPSTRSSMSLLSAVSSAN